MKNYKKNVEKLGLSLVKEEGEEHILAKRVDIVSLLLVKDRSLLYKDRAIRSLEDGYNWFKQFLGELDREYFVVMCLDVKNQPTAMNVCHIGSLNASIVHSREVMKTAVLSNAPSIIPSASLSHNYSNSIKHPYTYLSEYGNILLEIPLFSKTSLKE